MATIREGDPADLPGLREIQTALAEPWPALLSTAVDGPPPLLLVLVADGQPVAYAIAITEEAGLAYVPEFAVHPDRQGEGHGSELMAALLERLEADGHAAVRVTVAAADERAREFYTQFGFEVVERLPDHFVSGAGLLLEREL